MKENDKIIKVAIAVSGDDGLEYYNISHSDGTADKNFLVEAEFNDEMVTGAAYLYEQHTLGIEIDYDENLEDRDDGILQRFYWIMEYMEYAEDLEFAANALANDARRFRQAVEIGDCEGDCRLWGDATKSGIESVTDAAKKLYIISD